MRMIRTIFAGAAGLAAMAAAAPAAAQWGYSPYGYNTYGYGAMNTNFATQQCTAAVQQRLYNRTNMGGILGVFLGANTMSNARVLGVTRVTPTSTGVRVRGVASSGRIAYNPYSPYGYGAYGALGYGVAQQADLSFKCDVDHRGFIRDIDINRRF